MTMRLFAVSSLLLVLACGDDSSSGGGATGGSSPQGGNGTGGGATGAGDTGGAATGGAATGGAGTGGGACVDTSALAYAPGAGMEAECLTFESASSFCGFSSDDAVCNFAVQCGTTTDLGQCQINCEQGSSSFCNGPADVDCVVAALCADDCAALAACDFIL